jgi:Protein of unknown function (DUF4232)
MAMMGIAGVTSRKGRSICLLGLLSIAGLAASCVASPSMSGPAGSPSSLAGKPSAFEPAATPTGSLGADIVPWVDRTAPAYVAPTPGPYPTDARPCRPADLVASAGDVGAGLGNTNLPVRLVNQSDSPCLLDGSPTLAGLRADGTIVALKVGEGSYFGDPGPTANIGPGGIAAVNISGADACPAILDGAHRVFPRLRIGLPGGGSVDVAAGDFDTICGVSASRFGVPADDAFAVTTPPSPLTARIDAPATAAPGQTLVYSVTLQNPTSTAVSLSPCPPYEEFVGSGAEAWVATLRDYYLNCDAASTIPPGGSVTFEMRLQLPADQPVGQAKFGWDIHGDAGPWANAPLEIRPAGA